MFWRTPCSKATRDLPGKSQGSGGLRPGLILQGLREHLKAVFGLGLLLA